MISKSRSKQKGKWMKKRGFIYGLLVIGILFVMFRFSGQNTDASNGLSSRLAEWILSVIKPHYSGRDLNTFNLILRKIAHFVLYALLGIGLAGLIRSLWPKHAFLLVMVLGALAAVLDESHQYFVQGRNASFYDVLLDSSGVFTGSFIYHIIAGFWNRRKSKRQ